MELCISCTNPSNYSSNGLVPSGNKPLPHYDKMLWSHRAPMIEPGLIFQANLVSIMHGDPFLSSLLSNRWGLLNQFILFHFFHSFSGLSKHYLPIEYHIHIWQVSLQLSCSDTCQIWMWLNRSDINRNFPNRKINKMILVTPTSSHLICKHNDKIKHAGCWQGPKITSHVL